MLPSRVQLTQFGSRVSSLPGVRQVNSVWGDFIAFINRGSVVDLAVGLIMGAAFTSVVNSMVADLFSPLIGLASNGVNLDQLFVVMRRGKNCTVSNPNCDRFNTIAEAQLSGAVTWNYGRFLQNCINFILTSVIIYFVVKAYTKTIKKQNPKPKETKECNYCCKSIPIKAIRCPECTSSLELQTSEIVLKIDENE